MTNALIDRMMKRAGTRHEHVREVVRRDRFRALRLFEQRVESVTRWQDIVEPYDSVAREHLAGDGVCSDPSWRPKVRAMILGKWSKSTLQKIVKASKLDPGLDFVDEWGRP